MKLAWATDIHLDCTDNAYSNVVALAESSKHCDCVLLSGDISIAPYLLQHLKMMDDILQKPVYFVLGNHDYYFSNIMTTRKQVVTVCRSLSFMRYLSAIKYVKLNSETAIVGHDGWYDAINGNPDNNDILMNDWFRITDFSSALRASFNGKTIDKPTIINISRAICRASVNHIADGIKAAVRDKHSHIIVVTHVPPFRESYNGDKHRGTNVLSALPWYTSKTMGDTLLAAANAYPDVKFTILSGHLHSHYDDYLLNNLNVRVGNSQYGSPQISGFIDI